MLDFVRAYLDELLTGIFLLLSAAFTVLHPPVFATRFGLLLARVVLWSVSAFVAAVLAASRFSLRARGIRTFIFDFGPIVVAVVGYVGLHLLDASAITTKLGIPPFDREMMAADVAIFGRTPYLWFSRWGLVSGLFARVMSGFYAFYPLTPLLAAGWFLLRGERKQFRPLRRALILSFYSGYVCYLLIPVSGPLTLARASSPSFLESTRIYSFLASNFRYHFDCFPSLHTANPWLIVWLSRGKMPWWLMTAAIATALGIAASTIVLEVHYGIDVLAGLAWIFPVAAIARATLSGE